jgi:DNA-binding winged helix-turn-helix (wHTH) protein
MDVAKQPGGEPLLTTADLAAREDFTLGGVIVSPSTRSLRGPSGNVDVEPRVMQVLVLLAGNVEQVVTRETLFNRCWGGVYVGDDSLNRAVAAVRRAVALVGGRFEVETIPRTGYRLVVPKGEGGEDPLEAARLGGGIARRRALIAGSAAAAAILGGGGFWWSNVSRTDRRFDALMARGEKAMRKGVWDAQTMHILNEAIAIRPESAKAWGLLALLKSARAQALRAKEAPAAVDEAEAAARRALSLDAKEPNALLAMFELQGSTLDWTTRDQRLRQIIAIDPDNLIAIGELILLLQAAGRTRESWNWNERALAIEPLSVDFLSKRALKLWIAGRTSAADKVIDQVRALYPADPGPWWVRFLILALTGRPQAALAMLNPNPARLPPAEVELWRTCLAALGQLSSQTIARAREACFDSAKTGGDVAETVMILCALGQVGPAFDAANGYLLSRGSVVRQGDTPSKEEVSDATLRINTQWLFTPPCAVMRADARFLPLCDGMGLVEYWRNSGVKPDYLLTKS